MRSALSEEAVSENPPRFELTAWARDYGVIAGVTGRGGEAGRGFDLGLWSDAPVGEVMTRWRTFQRALPAFSSTILGNQIHGTEVHTVTSAQGWVRVEGVDGWVTATRGVLLTVTIADCIPVYLLAPGKGVGLLHAGWRGTAGGILGQGVCRLAEVTAVSPADIIMHCGVGICRDCYEVGSEVMAGCGLPIAGDGPWQLDLRDVLARQADQLGIRSVSVSTHCSAHTGSFYSHRRSRGADGRMVAYLGWPLIA
jgi:YfiH family protein